MQIFTYDSETIFNYDPETILNDQSPNRGYPHDLDLLTLNLSRSLESFLASFMIIGAIQAVIWSGNNFQTPESYDFDPKINGGHPGFATRLKIPVDSHFDKGKKFKMHFLRLKRSSGTLR